MALTNIHLAWVHSKVDATLPPITIQACSNLVTGSWSSVWQKQPVEGTNTFDIPISAGAFYRLCVTNAP